VLVGLPPASGHPPATQPSAFPGLGEDATTAAELSLHLGEEQCVGKDFALARRGSEPALGVTSAGIQSICEERRFKKSSSCSEEVGTEGQ